MRTWVALVAFTIGCGGGTVSTHVETIPPDVRAAVRADVALYVDELARLETASECADMMPDELAAELVDIVFRPVSPLEPTIREVEARYTRVSTPPCLDVSSATTGCPAPTRSAETVIVRFVPIEGGLTIDQRGVPRTGCGQELPVLDARVVPGW